MARLPTRSLRRLSARLRRTGGGRLAGEREAYVRAVSHELRTPLTSMVGFLELVLDGEAGPLTAAQEHYLDIVRRSTDRLARLVDDLSLAAQLDADGAVLRPADVDLADLAGRAVESARPAAAGADVGLALQVRARPHVEGDEARLRRVLDGLVGNALTFTPPGGEVEVGVDAGGGSGVVTVADTGSVEGAGAAFTVRLPLHGGRRRPPRRPSSTRPG